MTFKERAMDEAIAYASQMKNAYPQSEYNFYTTRDDFTNGAEWGYRQAVEQLRTMPNMSNTRPTIAQEMADWLLEKAGMKDE